MYGKNTMTNYYKNLLLLLTIIVTLSSCGNRNNYEAYFGGEITSPKSDHIYFCRDNKVIDTIALDENNRFFIKFDSLTPGMYSFKHEPYYQYVYFDKNDSLMVNIDTRHFDESIVFSGKGNEKNNFMMELYLVNEKDRNSCFSVFDYDFDKFTKCIDSTYQKRIAYYEEEKSRLEWSSGFDFYVKARLDFNYFSKKEYYPYAHALKTGKKINDLIPNNYYDYREEIEFNNPKLTNYTPFVRYFTAMLNNMAISKHEPYNIPEDTLEENITKLNLADSIFINEDVKNQVLNTLAFNYLLEDKNIVNHEAFLECFNELSTDDDESNEIVRIGQAADELSEGNKLPEIELVDSYDNPIDINNGINEKTVIFFWTSCSKSRLKVIDKKIDLLKQQYGEIDFIAINVDEDEEWKKTMKEYHLENACHLRASNFKALKDKWAFTKINRTIVLNPDGTIKRGFANLMDSNFSQHLR